MGFIGFYWVVTGFDLVLLDFTRFYWVFKGFYWVSLGLHGCTRFRWGFLGITGFYWFSLDFTRFH